MDKLGAALFALLLIGVAFYGSQEGMQSRDARERDAKRAPHCAARAVGGDHVAATDRHRTRWRLSRHSHGVAVLPHRRDLVAEADVSAAKQAEDAARNAVPPPADPEADRQKELFEELRKLKAGTRG